MKKSFQHAFVRFCWLYKARPLSLTLAAKSAVLILCLLLGYLCSALSVDSLELASYLGLSFMWMFGLILFCDFGGHFNDHVRHMTFWMNFMPDKRIYILNLLLTFLLEALLFSTLGIIFVSLFHLYVAHQPPRVEAIVQAIIHQGLGLTLVALFNYSIGTWANRGLRQILCVSWVITVFFLSSILPYFLAFNQETLNLFFEILPRLDLYDNRTSLLVAEVAFPWSYTGSLILYTLGESMFLGALSWLKLHREGWK